MKRLQKFLVILFLFFSVNPFQLFSQFTVTRVVDQNINTAQEGFYYALPQTVLKIDLVVDKIQQIKGPLSEYTENYLGTTDYVRSNNTIYQLVNVSVTPTFEPDPHQVYYVQFPAEKSKDETGTGFSISSISSLLAYNDDPIESDKNVENIDQTLIFMEGQDNFHYQADYHRKKKTDTITRKITIDTVSIERFVYKTSWVDKNDEDKANEAALQISNIREARFNLLTGYQEVNYGESMQYMDQQLINLERQYLELFLGKEIKSFMNQTIYYTPSKGTTNDVLTEFNGSSTVEINIFPSGNMNLLPENPPSKIDHLYYRIPEFAIIEIIQNGELLYREKILVNQLGITAASPLDKVKSQFDPETGSLIKIVRE